MGVPGVNQENDLGGKKWFSRVPSRSFKNGRDVIVGI